MGHVTNRLAARIGDLLARERELVADLSHRLRTHLARLRLDAEQLPEDEASERLRDDIDLMERGLTDLIRQARRERSGPPPVLDLAPLVRERAEFWEVLAEEQGRPWAIVVPDQAVPVAIDEEDAVAALDALLGNVFAHTPEDAACRVELEQDDARAAVVVRDAGPGFRRPSPEVAAAPARPGSASTSPGA